MQDDLVERAQHLITQPWSSLEAARAIILMVLEEAAAKLDEKAERVIDLVAESDRVTDARVAAHMAFEAGAAAIRAIGAP
jgi:hypothetical protein